MATVTVLIVDDTDLIRQLIADMLRLLPYSFVIEEAADVPQAVEALARCRPDVVTLDLDLPGESGLEVLAPSARPACPRP